VGKESSLFKNLIAQVNEVIALFDVIEEFRTLSVSGWDLRDTLKAHLIALLQNQNYYWKQRGKIKWVKLGDANTRFFHTKATINYRNNYISKLQNSDQAEVFERCCSIWKELLIKTLLKK
jgi:hypothetical protein